MCVYYYLSGSTSKAFTIHPTQHTTEYGDNTQKNFFCSLCIYCWLPLLLNMCALCLTQYVYIWLLVKPSHESTTVMKVVLCVFISLPVLFCCFFFFFFFFVLLCVFVSLLLALYQTDETRLQHSHTQSRHIVQHVYRETKLTDFNLIVSCT